MYSKVKRMSVSTQKQQKLLHHSIVEKKMKSSKIYYFPLNNTTTVGIINKFSWNQRIDKKVDVLYL